MTKSKKIVVTVLTVVLVIAIVIAALSFNTTLMGKITGKGGVTSHKDLSSVETGSFNSEYPLVQTEQKDLFYEINPDGTVKYYKYDGSTFNEVKDGISTCNAEFTCSYQKLSVKLYYLKTEAGTVGYGLFDSQQNKGTKLISYAFVRMMDCPEAFKKAANSEYILLVDRTADDSYKIDKTYSDMYAFNRSSGKATLVMSQRDRTVQSDGTVNEGWTIFTDSGINQTVKKDIFASSRTHDVNSSEPLYSIMTVKNSNASKKVEASVVESSPSYITREKDNNYFCFVKAADGFNLIKNGDKKNPVKTFSGKFSEYCVSGDWIFNKNTTEFTNLYTGETKSFEQTGVSGMSGFVANSDGSKFVIFINGDKQSVVMCNAQTGEINVVTDKIFDGGICNFCFINDEKVLFTDYDENKAAVNTVLTF